MYHGNVRHAHKVLLIKKLSGRQWRQSYGSCSQKGREGEDLEEQVHILRLV
jgi:hypothetical protein